MTQNKEPRNPDIDISRIDRPNNENSSPYPRLPSLPAHPSKAAPKPGVRAVMKNGHHEEKDPEAPDNPNENEGI
jgi:hypothetical protein